MICSSGSVLREHYQPVVKKITERSMRNSRQVTPLCIIIKTSSMAYIVADFMAQACSVLRIDVSLVLKR